MKTLVIGCGYLGRRVAELWHSAGHELYAMTRQQSRGAEFRKRGWRPIVADITNPDSLRQLGEFAFDAVLFAVGFDRSAYKDIEDVYVGGLSNVLHQLALGPTPAHFVYISSTGVYGNRDGQWVDETTATDPQRPGGKACLHAEQLIRSSQSPVADVATILRLAGIYGPDRIPRRQAIRERSWGELGQKGHVNLIEVSDAAEIVDRVIRQNLQSELFLVSDGHPVERKLFYEFIAQEYGIEKIDWPPEANIEPASRAAADKRISNRKLVSMIDYQFRFPDFRTGVKNAISDSQEF